MSKGGSRELATSAVTRKIRSSRSGAQTIVELTPTSTRLTTAGLRSRGRPAFSARHEGPTAPSSRTLYALRSGSQLRLQKQHGSMATPRLGRCTGIHDVPLRSTRRSWKKISGTLSTRVVEDHDAFNILVPRIRAWLPRLRDPSSKLCRRSESDLAAATQLIHNSVDRAISTQTHQIPISFLSLSFSDGNQLSMLNLQARCSASTS